MTCYAEEGSGWGVGCEFVLDSTRCALVFEKGTNVCHGDCGIGVFDSRFEMRAVSCWEIECEVWNGGELFEGPAWFGGKSWRRRRRLNVEVAEVRGVEVLASSKKLTNVASPRLVWTIKAAFNLAVKNAAALTPSASPAPSSGVEMIPRPRRLSTSNSIDEIPIAVR